MNEPGWARTPGEPLLFAISALGSFMTSVSQDLGFTSPPKDGDVIFFVLFCSFSLYYFDGLKRLEKPYNHNLVVSVQINRTVQSQV